MTSRQEMLREMPVPQLILKLSVPTIISMMVTALYNSADTYFVGKISTEATAAVGLVFSVMAIIQAVGFFCGHGSGNYLSRMLGANKKEEANQIIDELDKNDSTFKDVVKHGGIVVDYDDVILDWYYYF